MSFRLFLVRTAALLLPPALAIVAVLAATAAPEAPAAVDRPPPVAARVVPVTPTAFVARATGYGVVASVRTFTARARLDATVDWLAGELAAGSFLAADAIVLRFDDTDVRLDLASLDADLTALDVRKATARASLAIERREGTLLEAEWERQRELRARGTASQTAVDAAERAVIAALARRQTIENDLLLADAERARLEARRAVAARALEHTEVRAPIAMRVAEVAVERDEFVSRGTILFVGDDVAAAEVTAQFPLGRLRALVGGAERELPGPLGLAATVRLRAPERVISWEAVVDRVAPRVDPRSQSGAIVVRVDDHYGLANPGERPPLRPETLVEVELRAPPRTVAGIVPATAVREGRLLILDDEDRLRIVEAPVALRQGELVVLTDAIAPGTRVVVSDLFPATPGLAIRPVVDEALVRRLAELAAGR